MQNLEKSLSWFEIRAGYLNKKRNIDRVNVDKNSMSISLEGPNSTGSILDAIDEIVNLAVAAPSNYKPQSIPTYKRNNLVQSLVADSLTR